MLTDTLSLKISIFVKESKYIKILIFLHFYIVVLKNPNNPSDRA
jgi:hypothetical protein